MNCKPFLEIIYNWFVNFVIDSKMILMSVAVCRNQKCRKERRINLHRSILRMFDYISEFPTNFSLYSQVLIFICLEIWAVFFVSRNFRRTKFLGQCILYQCDSCIFKWTLTRRVSLELLPILRVIVFV